MNKNNFNKFFKPVGTVTSHRSLPFSRTLVLVTLCAALLATFFLSSCKEQKKEAVITVDKDVYYTCSMHPQVHEDHPGNCPICGMKLIAVRKTNMSMNTNNAMQVHLTPEQIRLGNIQTDTIGKESIGDNLVLAGTLNFNEDKLSSVSARVEGRIDKLYYKNIGDYVAKGAKLYDLYSEQLNNAKQEYVNALQQES